MSSAGCSGAACGTISVGGLYTAPAGVPSPATFQVTVTSVAASHRKNLKTRMMDASRDAIDVLDALELLILRVFAFVSLMYLLFRMIR